MSDEQELRQRLEAVAHHVSAPRVTIDGLIGRIRRRRAKIIGLVSGSVAAVAAIAVAVPIALGGASSPQVMVRPPESRPREARPAVAPFRLSFTVAVNGRSPLIPNNGSPPRFTVTPGKKLNINVGVTVPAHATVTTLWLGITKGDVAPPGRNGQRPAGMHPVLAHPRHALTAGLHTFRLTWTMPAHLARGTSLWLVAAWDTTQRDASVAQPVTEFIRPH